MRTDQPRAAPSTGCEGLTGARSAWTGHVVIGGEHMAFDDVKELLDRHVFIDAAHAGR